MILCIPLRGAYFIELLCLIASKVFFQSKIIIMCFTKFMPVAKTCHILQ